MGAQGDIYQVRVSYVHEGGELLESVFYYEQTTAGAGQTAGVLADELYDTLFSEFANLMDEGMTINRIFTINGMDNEDFNDTNPAIDGARTGSALPSVLAAGFRGPFPGPGQRRARHRLPFGVASDIMDAGRWTTVFRSAAATIQDLLGAQVETSESLLRPITIVGGFKLGVTPVKSNSAYGQWELDIIPTTQKTRQEHVWIIAS